jgi:hypothetical protein
MPTGTRPDYHGFWDRFNFPNAASEFVELAMPQETAPDDSRRFIVCSSAGSLWQENGFSGSPSPKSSSGSDDNRETASCRSLGDTDPGGLPI